MLLLAAGCFDFGFGGPWKWDDACSAHGNSGSLFGNDCSCPLMQDINPQLDGTPCTTSGLRCADSWLASFACTCESEPLRWVCYPPDLAASMPLDLSTLDYSSGDGATD
jgi:hypothetical protein